VIVFDRGGGTLDVSVMTIQEMTYTVEAMSGETHLGRRDFDECLMRFCLRTFDRSGRLRLDTLQSRMVHKLRAHCEAVKCELSNFERTNVSIDNSHGAGT
jgi:molecular chaperone DnaK (HSP70)